MRSFRDADALQDDYTAAACWRTTAETRSLSTSRLRIYGRALLLRSLSGLLR